MRSLRITLQLCIRLELTYTLAPNGPEKWGCRMRIQDLFSKIRDLLSTYETTRPKKTAGAPEPPETPSLAPIVDYCCSNFFGVASK